MSESTGNLSDIAWGGLLIGAIYCLWNKFLGLNLSGLSSMNTASLGALVAYPWVSFLTLIVEALPAAAISYGLIWFVLRPRGVEKTSSSFIHHIVGVAVTVAGSAIFRIVAMATFAGRSAYVPASETGAAAFYLFLVPALFAAGYIQWLKSHRSNQPKPRAASNFGNDAYAAALAEIEEGRLDKGVWARAFAEADGNETKAKALYIKARAGAAKNAVVWEDTQPKITDATSEKSPNSASRWHIADDIRKMHPGVKAGAILVLLLLFGSLVSPGFRQGLWGLEVRHATEATSGSQPMAQDGPVKGEGENTLPAKPTPKLDFSEFTAESQEQLKDLEAIRRADADFKNAYSALERRAYGEAFIGFSSLAVQGDARGQTNLGAMYNNGVGVAKNDAEAVKWYRLAAAQGNSTAQSNLGAMYALGQGVKQNILLAHMWLNLSAAAGNLDAANVRDTAVEKLMTPQQIALAHQMARDCQQRNFKGCD